MVIILFDYSIRDVVFFEVQDLRADQHHHLTPFAIHFASLFMMHRREQNCRWKDSIDFCVRRIEEMLFSILFLYFLQIFLGCFNSPFRLFDHLYVSRLNVLLSQPLYMEVAFRVELAEFFYLISPLPFSRCNDFAHPTALKINVFSSLRGPFIFLELPFWIF